MFGSAVLEVAIGMVFVFLTVSLVLSALTELISSWLRWRASNLWKALRGMLGEGVQEQLYAHPIIKMLTPPGTGVGALARWPKSCYVWPAPKGPSYISSRTFALALLDLLERPQRLEGLFDELRSAVRSAAADPANLARAIDRFVGALPSDHPLAARIVSELRNADPSKVGDLLTLFARVDPDIRQLLRALRIDPELERALGPLIRSAGNDIERLRTEIETWFNDMMDRVSGWYKRKTQAVQMVAAVLLAASLDLDAIRFAEALSRDGTLRQSVVAQAQAYVDRPTAAVTPEAQFANVRRQLTAIGFPLRGSCAMERYAGLTAVKPWWCDVPRPLYAVLLGWLLTALAASLGAPFWFDVLKKFISVRSAGRAPEERPTPPKEVPQPREPGQR